MFTELPPTQTPVCLSVCIWNNGSDYLFLFYFSDLYTSVVLFIGYIESMFFFFFFCESSVGFGGDSG